MSLSITPRQENEVLTGYQLNPSFEATFFSFPFPFLLFLKKKKTCFPIPAVNKAY
jgi:hypothetical protein